MWTAEREPSRGTCRPVSSAREHNPPPSGTDDPSAAALPDAALTPEEKQELAELTGRYQDRRAACIEALKLVQRRHRWISDARLSELATLLGMTAAELEGVATFYNLIFRRPVGRHVIMLCDSVSCWIMGHDALKEQLERSLRVRGGETTSDERFTLLPIVCLGHCDHAPAMMIDGDLHGDVHPERIDALLQGYR
jgi:NADH-quinone oxidoreductase subunit E